MGPTNRADRAEAAQAAQLVLDLGALSATTPRAVARPERRRGSAAVAAFTVACTRGAFDRDRRSERWDAGEPLRDNTVSDRAAGYRAKSLTEPEWAELGPTVRRVAAAAAQTPYAASTLASVATQLLAWCRREGLPLDDAVTFHPDTIDQFVAEGCRHLRPGTRLNYQSQLRRVGEQLVGPPLYPTRRLVTGASDPVPPYTADDVAALTAWGAALPTTRMREGIRTLLAFGLGAGLTSQELTSLIGTDVEEDADGVLVHVVVGCNPRAVPLLHRWERAAQDAAERAGPYPVLLPGRTRVSRKALGKFIESCGTGDAPKLSPQRLRVTWIVDHLAAGTPIHALAHVAGARPEQLATYASWVSSPSDSELRRLLRRAGSE